MVLTGGLILGAQRGERAKGNALRPLGRRKEPGISLLVVFHHIFNEIAVFAVRVSDSSNVGMSRYPGRSPG